MTRPETSRAEAPAGPLGSFSAATRKGDASARAGVAAKPESGIHASVAAPASLPSPMSSPLSSVAAARPAMVGLESRPWRAVVESVVITVVVPGIGYLIDRTDPFFLTGDFPWLVFAPLLIALRHGFTLGFGSAVVLDVALVLAWRTHVVPLERFPGEPLVGLLALSMIAGQFSDLWRRELSRLNGGLAVLRRQAGELARSHFLLEVSHDRLDGQVEHTRGTLREAMSALHELEARASGSVSFAEHGSAMMELFAAHCGLEVGELFPVEAGEVTAGCAVVGHPRPTETTDPMLKHAIASKQLTYIPAATRSDRDRTLVSSPLLAVIPFVEASGKVTAVLCVQAMPFISFERRNLDVMATLGGRFADLVHGLAWQESDARKEARGSHAASAPLLESAQ